MGSKNFKYLDELIHSGIKEIVLDSDIVLSDDEELQYLEGIKLDVDDLIINGNGHRIDAQGKARIFDCTGKDIIIRDIVLANGYAQKGGAIQNAGGLTMTEAELHKNTAELGGAIHNYKGNLKIIQSTISNNKTLKGSGGAIVNHRGDLRMVQSSLIQNTAFVGGAIYNYKSELTIIESVIDENTAEKYGGAIINSGKLTINQSSLEANNAEYGGAIYNLEHGFSSEESPVSELTDINYDLDGTIFNFDLMRICNSKKDCIELDNHCAINRVKSILSINDSKFTQNTADYKGGAIYSEGDALKISQSSITKNVAKDGGGICNRRGDLVIKDSKFQANRAEYQGDAIINHGNIFILSEDIGDNIANFGEMPAVESLKDNQRDFTYLNELIRSKSNEIKLEYDILLNIENLENQTFKNGIKIDCDDLIIDGAGHSIDAQGIVRIFECNAKDVKIKNIKLKNGSGKNDGCAIRNFGELIITDSLLTNNIAKYGAAISNYGDLTIKESSFADNESDYGAAIYNNHNLAIVESSFMNNESEFRGGAIYNNEGELTVNSSTFNNNTAQESGGAIYNTRGELTITESTLNNNTAEWYGGAIHNNNGELTITESTLNNNTGQRDGGAIHNRDGKKYESNNCTFKDNKPDDVY